MGNAEAAPSRKAARYREREKYAREMAEAQVSNLAIKGAWLAIAASYAKRAEAEERSGDLPR